MNKPMYYDGSGKLTVIPVESKKIIIKPEKSSKPNLDIQYPYPVHY